MRLFLLPVSTRRALLYCDRLPAPPAPPPPPPQHAAAAAGGDGNQQLQTQPTPRPPQHQPSLLDKAQMRASNLWAEWEKKPPGTWQQKVVSYSNIGFRRIAFEEWGLKSVPPLNKAQRQAAEAAAKAFAREKAAAGSVASTGSGAESAAKSTAGSSESPASPSRAPPIHFPASPVEVIFPSSIIPPDSVAGILHQLSTTRESLHRKRMLGSFVLMPISAPVAILPVIPNLPFFYLVYRAWSHWRAIAGGKHLQLLLQSKGLALRPSATLDSIYANDEAAAAVRAAGTPIHITGGPEKDGESLLLSQPGTTAVGDAYDSPQLEEALERAVWQIEKAKQDEEKRKQKAGGGGGGGGGDNSSGKQ